jgi:cytochrome c-type biogenesis protein CcmH/NrfF
MTKARPLIAAAILLGFATLPLSLTPVGAQQVSGRAKQIGTRLKCMCGACDMTASGCSHPGGAFSGPCQAWALPALREIDGLLAQGKTDQQIIDSFVAQYGPVIYAEPPKSGFSLVAWVMPTVYLVLGALVVIFVISRWLQRPSTEPTSGSSPRQPISPELLERARAQAERETED